MWKRGVALAAAIAFLAFLVWMLALGQYETLVFGLGVLAGSFAAHWLSGLRLPAAGFWAVTLGMLAVVMISWLLGSEEGYRAYAASFLYGAALFGFLFLLINRYGRSRESRRA